MSIVSIDLAYKRYSDNGIALLRYADGLIRCKFQKITLSGAPEAFEIADYLTSLCDDQEANILLVDGPQGWKHPDNGLMHSRICERALNTPAKSGPPGNVKPANYGPFVRFSIAVFEQLIKRGWLLYSGLPSDSGERTVFESFPMSAWKSLGISGLPAKSKAKTADITSRLSLLVERFPLVCEGDPTHDELQALVSGLAGIAYEHGIASGFAVVGESPIILDGLWREGIIVNPVCREDWRAYLPDSP